MKTRLSIIRAGVIATLLISFGNCCSSQQQLQEPPKIVNIVNFIRLLEPRDAGITEDVLYQTVAKQVEIMKKYRLGGTFLLQYDALMDPRYQQLLKTLDSGSFEIGAWWEIPQPLVEKAGLPWRGRYPWDWRANIGFSTGYLPKEREKLIDVYMADFKKIFGHYPRSVASWFIDAYSLDYMYKKYNIVASANCKDQYGTDGYTLWGGYWNQAYYPSRINAYMPAQNARNQVTVPIFRMLGSDPAFTRTSPSSMHISWPLKTFSGIFEIELNERQVKMKLVSSSPINWFFDLTTAEKVKLPFDTIDAKNIHCSFENMNYLIKADQGVFSSPDNTSVWRISPEANTIILNLADAY